jgi:hypothetical protein
LGYPERRSSGQVTLPSRRDARAGHRAQQEAGERGRAAGPGARAAERRVGELDEEPRGTAELEHRAVDREQHDVGGGDVERHAEEALEPHVALADDAVEAVALVLYAERLRDQAAEVRVGDEREHDLGQDPADRAAGRLEHEEHRHDARDHVERLGRGGAAARRNSSSAVTAA